MKVWAASPLKNCPILSRISRPSLGGMTGIQYPPVKPFDETTKGNVESAYPNKKWWPDRSRGGLTIEEFEAESVCHIVCTRMGIEHSSEAYLSYYLEQNNEIPPISIECVLKSAGLIEQMGRMRLKERKDA